MNADEKWRDDHRVILPALGTPQLKLVRGHGAYVWDSDGKRYTDLLAGIAVNALGHAHPDLIKAVTTQMCTLGHISNYFASDPQIDLATRLLQLAGAPVGSSVYFSNSGSEANEAALKIARKTGRLKIVAVEGGFHGRTLGSLAVTHKPAYREPFAPLMPGVVHVPFGDLAALREAVDESTAAVIIEPIQGEAGVRPHPPGYLRAAREATSAVGALLIFDEVQTGIGRTGTWFAHQNPAVGEGVVPDVMSLAKGLGGGLPLAATVTFGQQVTDLLRPGEHGSTYSGNPVATAAGLAVLRVIERDGLLEHVSTLGAYLRDALATGVTGVRGQGLLVSFEPGVPAKAFSAAAREAGFIVNPVTETRIRLAPPLIVTREQVDAFLTALPGIMHAASTPSTAAASTPQAPKE